MVVLAPGNAPGSVGYRPTALLLSYASVSLVRSPGVAPGRLRRLLLRQLCLLVPPGADVIGTLGADRTRTCLSALLGLNEAGFPDSPTRAVIQCARSGLNGQTLGLKPSRFASLRTRALGGTGGGLRSLTTFVARLSTWCVCQIPPRRHIFGLGGRSFTDLFLLCRQMPRCSATPR